MQPLLTSIVQANLWQKEVRYSVLATPLTRLSPALAAWEFVEKHKGEIQWDMVAMNPPLV
jgi:hypothetical protein